MLRLDRAHWTLLAALRRDGSLTTAAEALAITQSAASQRLREAERRLGVALVERRGKSVLLNAAGQRIAQAGDALEHALGAAESDAIWVGRRARPRLRLAWSLYDAAGMAALFTSVCAAIDDGVDLEFVRAAGEEIAVLLKRDDADLAVLPHPLETPGVTAQPIVDDRLVAVASTGEDFGDRATLAPVDFLGRRFLTYGLFPRRGWEYDRFFGGGRAFPTEIVKIESTELICALVARGEGLSILPRWSVPADPMRHGLRVFELEGGAIRCSWFLHPGRDDCAERADMISAFATALAARLSPQ